MFHDSKNTLSFIYYSEYMCSQDDFSSALFVYATLQFTGIGTTQSSQMTGCQVFTLNKYRFNICFYNYLKLQSHCPGLDPGLTTVTAMTGDLALTWLSMPDILNCSKHPAWLAGLIMSWLKPM